MKVNNLIVARFGGQEAANADEIKKAVDVLYSEPARRYVVVSAPGSAPDSIGITDMLYMCHANFHNRENYIDTLMKISDRYRQIIEGLKMDFDIDAEIAALKKSLELGMNMDYIGSRGEYIMARILAEYLNWDFADASELIFFNKDGTPDGAKTFRIAGEKLKNFEHAVIPSFYGSLPDGNIKTFTRGDCDSAGALIACAVKADLFEKWSESAKIFSADPEVMPDSEIIRNITYSEAVEFNYIGINITKDNDLIMLNEAGIPMKIRNTHNPDDDGMLISPKLPTGVNVSRSTAACIAGRKGFSMLHVHKYGMNRICDFNEKLFGLFARHNIACQHYLSGIHKMAIVLKHPMFALRQHQLIEEIKTKMNLDSLTVETGIALIAIVGEGIGVVKGIFGSIFMALARAGIKVKMIDQGSDDLSIIIGVSDKDYENAIRALYKAVILSEGE